jgi:hypothetical protein
LARKKKELEEADIAVYGEGMFRVYMESDLKANRQVILQVSKSVMEPRTLKLEKISS